ncbi:hypothetical protein CCY99_03050 [Helicobacter sp. 16-1353]|nr:hypothetical protein CCY99_03050 [Helicobacter sp. 16-1353]
MGQVDSADSVDSVKLDKFGNSATLKDSAESVESRVNSADSSILKKSCGESNAEFVESRVNSANKYGESTESKIEFHTESRAESKAESHAKSAESKAKSHADSPPTNTIYEICENCEIYNENANDLIKRISGDILYLDPPYNAREYGANYHILNTIALYDDFTPRGKTGLREYEKSAFCKKNLVADALDYLIKNADFDYIFLSYNDEGLLGLGEIEEIFKKYGKYERMEQIYQRFKADSSRFCKQDSTTEYLHILQK